MASRRQMLPVALAALPLLLAGCLDVPPDPPSGIPVFYDTFSTGYTPASFDPKQGAAVNALGVDPTVSFTGTSSIRLDVPSASQFAGGVVLASGPQDLTSANALVFWAKASKEVSFDYLGFGLNFAPLPSTYQTTVIGLPLTTEWKRYRIPIPNPARLTAEHGMFWYQDVAPINYIAWFDDVKFDTIDPALMALKPTIASYNAVVPLGGRATVDPSLRYTDFDLTERSLDSGASFDSGPAPAYFTYSSSNPDVAAVDQGGTITGVLVGNATITARLAGQDVPGAVTVEVRSVVPTAPETAAPLPTAAAANVIALYNSRGTYPNHPVDTWQTSWSAAGPLTTPTIAGTSSVVKKYSLLQYAGVDINAPGPKLDLSTMTTMHVDLWTPNGSQFGVQLVGWNGSTVGANAEVRFNSRTIKPFTWVSLEIPLSSFAGVNLAAVGQLLWLDNTPIGQLPDGSPVLEKATFFIDNVYFHK